MSRSSTDERAFRDAVAAEAARWFARVQSGNASVEDRAQFSQWLTLAPEHVQEYLATASLWRHLDSTTDAQLSIEALVSAARADESFKNIIDLASSPPLAARPPDSRGGRRSLRYLAVAASLGLLVAGAGVWFVADRHFNGLSYSTAIGEQTSFTLPDGSTVRLNTQSEVRVRFRPKLREISLAQGEAMFEVARDATRPFRVRVGDTTVNVLGTVFNVYRAKDGIRVTVLDGRVRVETRQPSLDMPRGHEELAARERARVLPEGRIVKDKETSIDQATAWTDRRLVFHATTLSAVVDEFNRYNVHRLEVSDPELATLHISGNFRAGDSASLVEFLRRTESVTAAENSDGSVRLFRKE